MNEMELWGGEIPECQKLNRVPYVQCDCPIHDFVAELIGVRSTRKEGYDPNKPVSLGWAAEHPEETEQILIEATKKEYDAKRRERILAEAEAELNYLLPSTVKGPDGSTGPDGYQYKRGLELNQEIVKVYKFGNYQPIEIATQPAHRKIEIENIKADYNGGTISFKEEYVPEQKYAYRTKSVGPQ